MIIKIIIEEEDGLEEDYKEQVERIESLLEDEGLEIIREIW